MVLRGHGGEEASVCSTVSLPFNAEAQETAEPQDGRIRDP